MYIVHDKQALFERSTEIKVELLSIIDSFLSYLLPSGTFRNSKFYVGNVRGDKGEILVIETIAEKAGLWHDFSTSKGGVIITIWHDATGTAKFLDTIEDLEQWLGRLTFQHKHPECPTTQWDYRDENDKIIARVNRYDDTTGRKRYSCVDIKNLK